MTEPNYPDDGFTADATLCTGIAIVQQGLPGYFNVYAQAAGGCNVIVSDLRNGSVSVHISVTTTTIGGQ